METMNDALAPNVIDNSPNRELISVLKDQIKKSKESKFAIGYFFLSGFCLVREDFPDSYDNLPFLKIVMGNETTYLTKEELVAGYNLRELFKQRMIEDLQKRELSEGQIEQLRTLKEFVGNNIIDVKQLPIRNIDSSDPAATARHDQIEDLVARMLDLRKRLAAAEMPDEKTTLQQQIDATDRQIDQVVYELYGLTEEEIRVVERG